jgi:rRNA processing protein Krr1/Pno1
VGLVEKIKEAVVAIKSLIKGSKQSSVFYYLEKARKKSVSEDLGLKQ